MTVHELNQFLAAFNVFGAVGLYAENHTVAASISLGAVIFFVAIQIYGNIMELDTDQ